MRLARTGHGPFSLVRHVGRKSGTIYETPLIVSRVPDGFVAELTYGPEVSWYRNIVAAGRCVIIFRGAEYRIDRIESCTAAEGLAAFGNPANSSSNCCGAMISGCSTKRRQPGAVLPKRPDRRGHLTHPPR